MTLKEVKKELKELLKYKKKKEELIKKLQKYFDKDKELEKEFEDKVPENCDNNTLQGEEFEVLKDNNKYLASNLGRIRLNKGNQPIIPQCQDSEWNWKLDEKKFKEKYKPNFENITFAKYEKVYDYFMKETKWLKEEYDEIQRIYPDCELQLHHICKKGDNRIDNMIYLPACIHREVHSKKSS